MCFSIALPSTSGANFCLCFWPLPAQLLLMNIVTIIVRTLLGLMFVFFGLNGFFHFLHMTPPPADSPAMHFFTAVSTSGFMNVVFALQVLGGLLLLINVLPVLGLTILCPIIFNIVLFHLTMARDGLPIAFGTAILALILVGSYWNHYRPIVQQPVQ
jgi:putative oxidoreductase